MQTIHSLSDQTLLQNTHSIAQNEKSYSLALIEHLLEIDNRKLYATLGFDSLFKYVVRELGYSESIAYERIRAMRLVRRVPLARDKLQSGDLNLTNAAKLESFRRQESLPDEGTAKLVNECLGKTGNEVEKLLLSKSGNPIPKDRTRQLTPELKEAKLVLAPELQALILRFEELHGKKPLSEILKMLLTGHLKKADPQQREAAKTKVNSKSPAETSKRCVKNFLPELRPEKAKLRTHSRFIPAEIRRQVWLRSQGTCEWRNKTTGVRCTSRYRLQFDHFPTPYARGGANTLSNLRHACPAHNARFAVEGFGAKDFREAQRGAGESG